MNENIDQGESPEHLQLQGMVALEKAETDTPTIASLEKPLKEPQRESDENIKLRKKGHYLPPNHFVGIKICSQEIVTNVEKIQQNLLLKNKFLEKALIPLPTLHLTVALMQLDVEDEETMKRAIEAMERCGEKLKSDLINDPLVLTIEGLDHFNGGVLFSKVKEGDALDRLTDICRKVQESFTSHGIILTDDKFNPHLTLAKVSKLQGRWKDKKVIKQLILNKFYKEYQGTVFGNEKVESLQLLSMTADKDENGYYHCLKSISFGANT